jgi:hypothetical protein
VRRNVLGAAELILPGAAPLRGTRPLRGGPEYVSPLALAGIVSAVEIFATGRASSYAKRPRRVTRPLASDWLDGPETTLGRQALLEQGCPADQGVAARMDAGFHRQIEPANLTSPSLAEVVDQTYRGIDRVGRTPHLAYSFLRHAGLSVA